MTYDTTIKSDSSIDFRRVDPRLRVLSHRGEWHWIRPKILRHPHGPATAYFPGDYAPGTRLTFGKRHYIVAHDFSLRRLDRATRRHTTH